MPPVYSVDKSSILDFLEYGKYRYFAFSRILDSYDICFTLLVSKSLQVYNWPKYKLINYYMLTCKLDSYTTPPLESSSGGFYLW